VGIRLDNELPFSRDAERSALLIQSHCNIRYELGCYPNRADRVLARGVAWLTASTVKVVAIRISVAFSPNTDQLLASIVEELWKTFRSS
jgi:hypothetical protein